MEVLSQLAPVIPLISAVLGAIVGGLLVHWLAVRRAGLDSRRSQRVEHLIRSYRGLIGAANRMAPLTPTQNDALETALTDIMLLGQQPEIDAAAVFIRKMGAGEPTNLDALIDALRSSLRDELALDSTPLPRDRVLRIDWTGSGSQTTQDHPLTGEH